MKTSKNYRLSQETLNLMEILNNEYSFESMTDLIERAVFSFAAQNLTSEQINESMKIKRK